MYNGLLQPRCIQARSRCANYNPVAPAYRAAPGPLWGGGRARPAIPVSRAPRAGRAAPRRDAAYGRPLCAVGGAAGAAAQQLQAVARRCARGRAGPLRRRGGLGGKRPLRQPSRPGGLSARRGAPGWQVLRGGSCLLIVAGQQDHIGLGRSRDPAAPAGARGGPARRRCCRPHGAASSRPPLLPPDGVCWAGVAPGTGRCATAPVGRRRIAGGRRRGRRARARAAALGARGCRAFRTAFRGFPGTGLAHAAGRGALACGGLCRASAEPRPWTPRLQLAGWLPRRGLRAGPPRAGLLGGVASAPPVAGRPADGRAARERLRPRGPRATGRAAAMYWQRARSRIALNASQGFRAAH